MRWDLGVLGPLQVLLLRLTMVGHEPESLVATLVVCGVSPVLQMVICSQDEGQPWFSVRKLRAVSIPAWWLRSRLAHLLGPRVLTALT